MKPLASASAAASDKPKDPPGTYATPWEHLSATEIRRISGRWQKLEMKICVHCGGHVDGAKYKKRVCPGPFACQVLADNGVKLIKVSTKVTKNSAPPAGALASVVPPVPSISEDAAATPGALTALAINTHSIDTRDSFNWKGADDGRDY